MGSGVGDAARSADDAMPLDALEVEEARRQLRAHSPRRGRRRAERLRRPIMALAMTPMIDVVFQLLVYFLVATDFTMNEEIYRVDLPSGGRSAPSEDPFELDREPIRVLVTTVGAGTTDYRLEVVGLAERISSLDGLVRLLRSRFVDPSTGRGTFESDHPVILEPSPGTTWEHAVDVFNAAVRAGCTNVIFQALP
ncbi:MAG TPA: biopolymer transporter ExbD [Phycisphaerales bacterium]|nr:biopolymer transporter ExbD [Phycisphaerales bacterium]HMP35996.1 biopolymer transporter ExbD [Phycisphaerales bacterium]